MATRNSLTERQKLEAEGKSPTKSIKERAREGDIYEETLLNVSLKYCQRNFLLIIIKYSWAAYFAFFPKNFTENFAKFTPNCNDFKNSNTTLFSIACLTNAGSRVISLGEVGEGIEIGLLE